MLALPGLSFEKIKAGVFNGSQNRQLKKDEHLLGTMLELKSDAWLSFKNVVRNFLRNI